MRDLDEFQERLALVGDAREVGPDLPVEDVGTQDFQGFRGCIDHDGLLAHATHRIHQKRQHRHMVQVGVRDEHVVDHLEFCQAEVADSGSGIDQDVLIHQHRGGAQVPSDSAAAAKHTNQHPYPPRLRPAGRAGRRRGASM